MPLYLYRCRCGNEFEAIKPIALRDEAHCPKCDRLAQKKLSPCNSTFGFRLTADSHDPVRREMVQGGKDKIERNV